MSSYKHKGKNTLLSTYTANLGSVIDRNRLAKAEKAKLAEAERIGAITNHFIANMSHELRTPLNSILGFSQMLSTMDSTQDNTAKSIEYGTDIHKSATQLLAIINEILDISRIQSDQYTLSPDHITIEELLDDCLNMLQIQSQEKEIEIHTSIQSNMPELFLDPVKIRQILTNIITNAIKFTPKGGDVTILAHILETTKIQVTIADNGVGMTAEEIGLAMTPFGQVIGDLSREHQGTGLGLPIAKALIELHGGALEVNSEKGKGSIFDIILPINKTDQKTE